MELLQRLTAEMRDNSSPRPERVLTSPQGPRLRVAGLDGEAINLCSNDYLGLSNHPQVLAAARYGLDRWGYGLGSVRFICGTQGVHKELESVLSDWLGMEDTLLYTSCFNANLGLFESLLRPEDTLVSARLNHASIIDGARLARCTRRTYHEEDPDDLDSVLSEVNEAGSAALVMTDGVFSMEGSLAPLDRLGPVCATHGALLAVDDSHAAGLVGESGGGTPEHFGVRPDILTGTLGKALGGACGGYIAGPSEIIGWLRGHSRPYLFSNSLAPSLVCGALAAIAVARAEEGRELRGRLAENAARLRTCLSQAGFEVPEGKHPIIPVMFQDAAVMDRMADRLLERGVYAIGFKYPVVPKESPRIRLQVSAAHSAEDIDRAVDAFVAAAGEV